MLTLESFEQAAEIVKQVTSGNKAGIQRIISVSRQEIRFI